MGQLGVSKNKIWNLVKDGVLPAIPNPLDRREKLVKREDVDKLAEFTKIDRLTTGE